MSCVFLYFCKFYVDPNGDDLTISNGDLIYMVYSEPDEDGSYSGYSRVYSGDSLTWGADGILNVDFQDDIQPSFLGYIQFYGDLDISDGSSETSLHFNFNFKPNI